MKTVRLIQWAGSRKGMESITRLATDSDQQDFTFEAEVIAETETTMTIKWDSGLWGEVIKTINK